MVGAIEITDDVVILNGGVDAGGLPAAGRLAAGALSNELDTVVLLGLEHRRSRWSWNAGIANSMC